MTNRTMEDGPVESARVFPLKMVIIHSYLRKSLPERNELLEQEQEEEDFGPDTLQGPHRSMS